MSNPYQSPHTNEWADPQATGRNQVNGPAVGLIIVSSISVGLLLLSLPFDVFLLFTGILPQEPGEIDPQLKVTVRLIWGVFILLASCFSLYGAVCMKRLRNYDTARIAAMVACIPCLGPCCLLGIPFGAWALITLNKPEVKAAFTQS
jgi:uncharacterized membrane protein YhaH (DUF805 family)